MVACQTPASQPVQDDQPTDAGNTQISTIALKHLGTIKLEIETPPAPAIRNILDWDIDDGGRIGFYRMEGSGDDTFVLVDPAGSILCEVSLNIGKKVLGLPKIRWVGGDRWVIVAFTKQGAGVAWWVDAARNELLPIEEFDCARIEAVAGDRRGGFVVLAKIPFRENGRRVSYSGSELIAFDRSGKRRWSVGKGEDEQDLLPSTVSMGVTSTGEVALLDISGNHWTPRGLQIFDKTGRYLHNIDLGANWAQGRGGELAVDQSNHFVLTRPHARPSTIQRIRADGSGQSGYEPRYPNERRFIPLKGVRVSPDGRLWACDGESFLRLDENGIVDRVLGEEPSDRILRPSGWARIDQRGRSYLMDKRTGSVHVFGPTGKRLHICTPDPGDFCNRQFCRMAVESDGGVLVWNQARYLRFSPDGKRLGFDKMGLDWVRGGLLFKPDDSGLWIKHSKEVFQADAAGKYVRTIRTRPDGQLLRWVAQVAVAPDGAIAVIGSILGRDIAPDQIHTINLYSSEGDPIRTLPMPLDGHPTRPAFNGRHLVIGKWFGDHLLLFDAADGALRKLVPPGGGKGGIGWGGGWAPFFTKQGEELWLLRLKTRTIERYLAP